MNIKELQEEILNGNIEFSGVIHYDEEYLWIKHQPYIRLTILDAENKLIIEDTVIPRDYIHKRLHKNIFRNITKQSRNKNHNNRRI